MIRNDVQVYCCEDVSMIENYDIAISDDTQTYDCHHRLEEELDVTKDELKEMDLYYNRPSCELIFLTRDQHLKIHHGLHPENLENWIKAGGKANKGRKHSEAERQNTSRIMKEYYKTHNHPMTGRKHSEATKELLREKSLNNRPEMTEDILEKLSNGGKRGALVKKCYITESGEEVWMRPSNKAQFHPNWIEKIIVQDE